MLFKFCQRLFQKGRVFRKFLGSGYEQALQSGLVLWTKDELEDLVAFAKNYFRRFGAIHRRSYREFLEAMPEHYPADVEEADLPEDLLGLFIPHPDSKLKGKILLSRQHSPLMHFSTLGHENGHVLVYYWRQSRGGDLDVAEHRQYARAERLWEDLNDPEELLADVMTALGGYPYHTFVPFFCNRRGELRRRYRYSSLLLMLAAHRYTRKHYPEIFWNFFRSRHKFFHLCLSLHLVRLRAFLYQNYGL